MPKLGGKWRFFCYSKKYKNSIIQTNKVKIISNIFGCLNVDTLSHFIDVEVVRVWIINYSQRPGIYRFLLHVLNILVNYTLHCPVEDILKTLTVVFTFCAWLYLFSRQSHSPVGLSLFTCEFDHYSVFAVYDISHKQPIGMLLEPQCLLKPYAQNMCVWQIR